MQVEALKILPDLSQKFYAKAKELYPAFSSNSPITIPVKVAIEVAQEFFNEQRFLPLGDNHHNAMACPHCRSGKAVVAVDPKLAARFVNSSGPWSVADEKAMIQAFKEALENYS